MMNTDACMYESRWFADRLDEKFLQLLEPVLLDLELNLLSAGVVGVPLALVMDFVLFATLGRFGLL
jgi:hypothetical protein